MEFSSNELCNMQNLYYTTVFQYYLLMIVNLFGLYYINKFHKFQVCLNYNSDEQKLDKYLDLNNKNKDNKSCNNSEEYSDEELDKY